MPLDNRLGDFAIDLFRQSVDLWLGWRREAGEHRIDVRHLSELHFDASIGASWGRRFSISVTDGCGLAIFDAAMSLAADASFLPRYPVDMRQVMLGRKDKWYRFRDYSWVREHEAAMFGQGFMPLRFTTQESRTDVASHLSELCVKMLMDHEEGHVILGHIGAHGAVTFSEIRGIQAGQEPAKADIQTIRRQELQADQIALYWACMRGRDVNHRATAHLEDIKDVFEWDVLVLLAAAVIFSIVEICERELAIPDEDRTHPSAACRMLHSLVIYATMVARGEENQQPRIPVEALDLAEFFRKFWIEYLDGLACVGETLGVAPLTYRDLQGVILVGTDVGYSPVGEELSRLVTFGPRGEKVLPVEVPQRFLELPRRVF